MDGESNYDATLLSKMVQVNPSWESNRPKASIIVAEGSGLGKNPNRFIRPEGTGQVFIILV
jgi:hypothetical protein